jgi:transcriptional regulator with XRE-family HTH domain
LQRSERKPDLDNLFSYLTLLYTYFTSMELNNKIIGRNLARFRKFNEIKAADLAERIGMKEAAYTKYERGESQITVELVQKVAEALKVDPISILASAPDNIVENNTNSNSPGANIAVDNNVEIAGDFYATDKTQTELMLKQTDLMMKQNDALQKQNETIIKLIEKVIDVFGKK